MDQIYTYTEMVEKIRSVYEYADARNIFEHVAIQINVSGQGAGISYLEVADRAVCVEPYDYKDRDGEVFVDGLVMIELLEKGIGFDTAREKGLVRYEGNLKKLKVLRNLVLPGKRDSGSKPRTADPASKSSTRESVPKAGSKAAESKTGSKAADSKIGAKKSASRK